MPNETVTYDLADELREMKSDIKQILLNQTKLDAEMSAIKAQNWTLIITASKNLDKPPYW